MKEKEVHLFFYGRRWRSCFNGSKRVINPFPVKVTRLVQLTCGRQATGFLRPQGSFPLKATHLLFTSAMHSAMSQLENLCNRTSMAFWWTPHAKEIIMKIRVLVGPSVCLSNVPPWYNTVTKRVYLITFTKGVSITFTVDNSPQEILMLYLHLAMDFQYISIILLQQKKTWLARMP